jgi:osmotically-inducible protein OsmY
MVGGQLQTNVQLQLRWDPGLDASHIAVTVNDGAVTLSGYVPSYFQKRRAVTTAERIYGVKAVADEIEVHLDEEHAKQDSEIAKSVAHILEWNTVLAAEPIKATVSDSHVTLEGEVAWNYEREEASLVVERVVGVKSVTNKLTVKPRVAASQVERQITNALARNAVLNARKIHVTTSGRKAVLTGHVHSLTEDRVAKDAAWRAEGINEVEDHLVVEP